MTETTQPNPAASEPLVGLLPCPFCGDPKPTFTDMGAMDRKFVMCGNCGADLDSLNADGDVREAWNRRATPTHQAAEPALSEQGQLDPRTAYETAQRMLHYVDAFNGEEWALSTLGGNVDRKNLGVALDNLQECAAMLLNQSDRLRAALAASPAPSEFDPSLGKASEVKGEPQTSITAPAAAPLQVAQQAPLTDAQIDALARQWSNGAPMVLCYDVEGQPIDGWEFSMVRFRCAIRAAMSIPVPKSDASTPPVDQLGGQEPVAKVEAGVLVWSKLPKGCDALLYAGPIAGVKVPLTETCEWSQDGNEDGSWFSACGGDPWYFEAEDPTKNGMRFCIHCGKRMVQRAPEAGEQTP